MFLFCFDSQLTPTGNSHLEYQGSSFYLDKFVSRQDPNGIWKLYFVVSWFEEWETPEPSASLSGGWQLIFHLESGETVTFSNDDPITAQSLQDLTDNGELHFDILVSGLSEPVQFVEIQLNGLTSSQSPSVSAGLEFPSGLRLKILKQPGNSPVSDLVIAIGPNYANYVPSYWEDLPLTSGEYLLSFGNQQLSGSDENGPQLVSNGEYYYVFRPVDDEYSWWDFGVSSYSLDKFDKDSNFVTSYDLNGLHGNTFPRVSGKFETRIGVSPDGNTMYWLHEGNVQHFDLANQTFLGALVTNEGYVGTQIAVWPNGYIIVSWEGLEDETYQIACYSPAGETMHMGSSSDTLSVFHSYGLVINVNYDSSSIWTLRSRVDNAYASEIAPDGNGWKIISTITKDGVERYA